MRIMLTKRTCPSLVEAFQVFETAILRNCRTGILELRKEKSRDAARSRRGKENYEFYELAKLLPLPAAITSQLDKASIIRLTISYLKLRDFSCHGDPQWTQEGGPIHGKLTKGQSSRLDLVDPFESRQGTHILQSLDGFAFILANDGRFLYISETVSIYLGLSQVEMAGSSIFEYVHPQDHTELAEHLGMCIVTVGPSGSSPTSGSEDGSSPNTPRPSSPSEKGYMMVHKPDKSTNKSFSLRMKSTLTKRGVHVKTSGYRVVHILGTLRPQSTYGASRSGAQVNGVGNGTGTKSNVSEPPLLGLVGMAIALPPPTITELRLELDTFITRLSPDFKVIYCEPIISDLMDLAVEDFTDRLLYDLCHVADLKSLKRSHEDILTKGQALTDYYRIMNRHGGYVWVQTCATTLLNNKNAEDQSILAINYVVSGVENKTSACDLWQVTGDVSSAMSSSSNSRCREEKLKELKASKLLGTPANKKLAMNLSSPASSTPSLSPNNVPKTDNKTDDVKHTSGVKPIPTTEKSPKTQPQSPTDDGGNLSPGKSADGKNKRRKMDNPRKRKRSSSDAADQHEKALNLTRGSQNNNSLGAEAEKQTLPGVGCSVGDVTAGERKGPVMPPLILHPELVTSSSPEDLSMKKLTNIALDRRIIQHSSNVYTGVTSPTSKKRCVVDQLDNQSSSSPISSITGNSVQELEAAMNRHLPSNNSSLDSSVPNEGHPFNGSITTSSAMPKSFSCHQSGLPTSVASSTSPWLTAQKASGSDVLTASNFLRSLYANRESVIKTSSRSQVHFLNPEPPTSLLTPPEPDPTTYKDSHNPYSYGKLDSMNHGHIYDKNPAFEAKDHLYRDQNSKDQFSFISYKDHIPSSYIDHISSSMYKDHLTTSYKDHLTSTYKDMSPYRDIIPAFTIPSLMSPTGRMHQAYPSLPHHFSVPMSTATMDACSITPPSSNSPEVSKLPAPQQYDVISGGYPADMSGTCNVTQKQTMLANPLVPSVPSLPPASPTTHGGHYQSHTQRQGKEQLYHVGGGGGDLARGGYYGVTPQTAGSMYMDLNQSSTGQYETCNRPVLPWY